MKKKPVTLLSGYLGSGKTTLMNQILLNQQDLKVAVIVNDMGEINIDASVIEKKGFSQEMIELSNGCICCTLREDFMTEIERISRDSEVDYILVEASGISSPLNIAEAFDEYECQCREEGEELPAYIDSIVAVVDANRIYSEFIEELKDYEIPEDEDDVINLVVEQIEFCNQILLNKCDLLNEKQRKEVHRVLRMLQPTAEIRETINCKVQPETILNRKLYDYEGLCNSSSVAKAQMQSQQSGEESSASEREKELLKNQELDEYGITSFVFQCREPFVREQFMDWIENHYPKELIRAKGFVWFTDDDRKSVLFEQAGNSVAMTEMPEWMAAMSPKEQEEARIDYPESFENWDERYGDRENQVVFIGQKFDEEKIRAELKACLELEYCPK